MYPWLSAIIVMPPEVLLQLARAMLFVIAYEGEKFEMEKTPIVVPVSTSNAVSKYHLPCIVKFHQHHKTTVSPS